MPKSKKTQNGQMSLTAIMNGTAALLNGIKYLSAERVFKSQYGKK